MKQKLSDIYELQMGKTPARKEPAYWNGNNMWVSISDLSANGKFVKGTKECITDAGVKASGIKIVPKGTLMMSFKLSLGKVAVADCDLYTNEAIMSFIDKGDYEVYRDYMYYQLQAIDWSLYTNKAVKGATLNKGTLSDVLVKIPKIEEQKTVAGKLEKVDRLIDNLNRQNELVEESIKSRFIEMFGDLVTNPMGWEVSSLDKHLDVVGGYAFKSSEFAQEGIPVLRIGNINSGKFQENNMVYFKKDDNLSRYEIYPGDLVISLTGTVGKNDYGNVCIMGKDYPLYYLNQRNAKLALYPTLSPQYLAEVMKDDAIKGKLTSISRGIRQANISNKDILNLEIPIPPIDVQNQFADFVTLIDKSKMTIQKSIDNLMELRDSLLQEYFG